MSLGLVTRALAQGSEISRPCPCLHSAGGQRPNLEPRSPCLPPGPAGSRTDPSYRCRCCCRGVLDAGCVPAIAGSLGAPEPSQTAGSVRGLLCGPGRWTDSRRPQALCGLRHSRPAECPRLNRPALVLDGIPPSSSSFTFFVFTNLNVGFKGCFNRG